MRAAYNVPSSLNGSGQTIVIVDAFGSPTIQDDLKSFDAIMNLPDPALRVFYPQGQPAWFDSGWAAETSLDVEWAHAIAPAAQIDLVIAPTNQSTDLHAALAYAVANHLGSVISMSFGEPEPSIPGGAHNELLQHADAVFQRAKADGITLIASTGDAGATNGAGATANAVFPASDPLVTSVGGTSLFISDTGKYGHETVWNDSEAGLCPFNCAFGTIPYATGGAPSAAFKTPSYQHNLGAVATREVADVSYNAGVYTAVLVYMSFNGPDNAGLYFTGGTSCGAPQWAGIVALANQAAGHPLGYINTRLYNIAKGPGYHLAFHDITVGNDGLFGAAAQWAKPGYDMPTGLGSPNVANLIPALERAQT
jgi:subtilase family serine protease